MKITYNKINNSILVQTLKVLFGVSLRLNIRLGCIHRFENVQKVYKSSHLVECTFSFVVAGWLLLRTALTSFLL